MVCVFKHLYCSAQLSMSSMEKCYRNKIIIIIIIIHTGQFHRDFMALELKDAIAQSIKPTY